MANTRDMSFSEGFQRGSASGCKRSNQQEMDTPRQPAPVEAQYFVPQYKFIAAKGARFDLVSSR